MSPGPANLWFACRSRGRFWGRSVTGLGLEAGGLGRVANMQGVVGLLGGRKGAHAFLAVPVALVMDGIGQAGFGLTLGDPGVHACFERSDDLWLALGQVVVLLGVLDQARFYVRDLGSTHGVKVDGSRVEETSIRPGLEVTIGPAVLRRSVRSASFNTANRSAASKLPTKTASGFVGRRFRSRSRRTDSVEQASANR